MSTTNDGGPAFPNVPSDPGYCSWDQGMTLRDYFAAKALAGMWANPALTCSDHIIKSGDPALQMARSAYEQADAMLSASAQGGKEGA